MIWDPLDDLEELGAVDLEDQLEAALDLAFARQTQRRRRIMPTADEPINAPPVTTKATTTGSQFKVKVHALLLEIEQSGVSRELALAKTKLEEALHWLESHHAKTTPEKAAQATPPAATAPK